MKVLLVWVSMMCLTMHSPESLCDTDLFHQALSNFSAKKHLAEVQIPLTSASPVLPRTQASGPGTTESELAILSFISLQCNNTKFYIFTMQQK